MYMCTWQLFYLQHKPPNKIRCTTLSTDEDVSKATSECTLTHNQLLIERVICKTFIHQTDIIDTLTLKGLETALSSVLRLTS